MKRFSAKLSLVGFESSNKSLKFRCLGEQILFVFNVCLPSVGTKWFQRYFSRNLKQNSSLVVFKTQQQETVWLWISKYNKIVKHGRSLYLKAEPLSSNSSL